MINHNVQTVGFGTLPKFRSYPGIEILIVNKKDFLHNFPYPVYLCSLAHSWCQCLLPWITDAHTDQLRHQNLDSFSTNLSHRLVKVHVFVTLHPNHCKSNSIVAKTANLIHSICPLWERCHDHIVIVEIFSEYLSKLQPKAEGKVSSQVWIILTRN